MKQISRSLAATLAFVASVAPAAGGAADRIPFVPAGEAIAVQASIDGRPPATMIVDLSAGMDQLGPNLRSLAYDLEHTYVTMLPDGQRLDLPAGRVVSFSIGDFPLEEHAVAVTKAPLPSGAEGIVSLSAFRGFATTIDYPGKQLVVEDAASFAERKQRALRVPMVLQDDRSIALRPFAWFDFGGHEGLCALNTAIDGMLVDKRFAKATGMNAATLPSVRLRDEPRVEQRNVAVTYADLVYDCVAGNGFWTGRTVTYDVPNRFLWVSSSP